MAKRRLELQRLNLVAVSVFLEVDSDSESEPASDDDGNGTMVDLIEASTMSRSSLRKTLGDEQANEVSNVFFQHTSRQTAPAHPSLEDVGVAHLLPRREVSATSMEEGTTPSKRVLQAD